ncbi:MetQ/NlpA family ABC transporter substrate-binding protein [Gluconobacter albidus]|uniref:Lipoprotein n=1 Tax=Gluconobacter albidus TaxID=318683 RepID=A0ABQ5X143_9PROT|nr:MetQ/NlpA family lipoprotein [Gluconobacter albidus]GBQ88149.1 D-methionine transporter substrate-binding periplasmic protein [Gluconobacter albidus NBRC 3250]GLQ69409.1 lipoprotein [Gluconobacter albidus]
MHNRLKTQPQSASEGLLGRRRLLTLVAATSLMGASAKAQPKPVRVGILSGEDEDIWRIVQENTRATGLTIEIVTFSEGNPINAALAAGDLEANAFQHGPYLQAQNTALGSHIVPVGNTYFAPIGFYSKKWKTLSTIPDGATIGVPADPTNEGRALKLLQSLGLLKISSEAGEMPTALDISENPKNLTIRELDDPVLARSLPDLDAGVVITEWAYKAGIDLKSERLARESMDNNPYINFIAVNEPDAHAAWVQPLVSAFQKPNIRAKLLEAYHGAIIPSWT